MPYLAAQEANPTDPPTLDDGMLLECVVTSTNADGSTNIAPMGPIVDPTMTRVLLRPFQTSTTFGNLVRSRTCVLHITDDVELIARAALNLLTDLPELQTTVSGAGKFLTHACRWYELQVDSIDARNDRSEILCHVHDRGRLRDFVGFNRAMHAVIEATILATRLNFLSKADVLVEFDRLHSPVEKTGGPRERRAFALVKDYVSRHES